MAVPDIRIRVVDDRAADREGEYVLYWMIAARRTRYNFALERAAELAAELGVGLVVLEALRAGYRWASDRLHAFVIDGMADNRAALADRPALYLPYVEPMAGHGAGLLAALADRACAVVTDDFPCFFLPRMVESAASTVGVRFEAVDSNGIYPMRATERVFTTAASFRRHLQKTIGPHLDQFPARDPLAGLDLPRVSLAQEVTERWRTDIPSRDDLSAFDIDHSVAAVDTKGGAVAGEALLRSFVQDRLPRYADDRNQPTVDAQSHLSPYLHFGHVSAHHVFKDVVARDDWSPADLLDNATGSREGWWGASREVEAFLDELITWREIGYNQCALNPSYSDYESLPEWAKKTLADHADDPRPYVYSLAQFEQAETHDPLWNAAQTQLFREGTVHNYLRMLWGKKILEWTHSPRDALAVMIELNNKYALDGRNPNSYSGIFWVLGRYDRAWGPERDIFGKVRFMSSDSTARKLRVKPYLAEYGSQPGLL